MTRIDLTNDYSLLVRLVLTVETYLRTGHMGVLDSISLFRRVFTLLIKMVLPEKILELLGHPKRYDF